MCGKPVGLGAYRTRGRLGSAMGLSPPGMEFRLRLILPCKVPSSGSISPRAMLSRVQDERSAAMAIEPPAGRITAEEFLRLSSASDKRLELVNGEIVEISPIG